MGQYDTRKKIHSRLQVAEVIIECDGVLRHAAHDLGIHRSHIYRMVHEHRLWPVVNKVRVKRLEREAYKRRKD